MNIKCGFWPVSGLLCSQHGCASGTPGSAHGLVLVALSCLPCPPVCFFWNRCKWSHVACLFLCTGFTVYGVLLSYVPYLPAGGCSTPLMLMCERGAVSVGTQPVVASTFCCVCLAAGSFLSEFLTSVVMCILLETHFVIFCFPVICTFLSYKFFELRSPQSKPSPSLLPSSADGAPPTQSAPLCFSSSVLPRIHLVT